SYVLEFAVSQIAIERVAAVAGDIEIKVAVVVVVGHRNTHAPAAMCESSGLGDVHELAVFLLVIERYQQIAAIAFKIALAVGVIDDHEIKASIVIALEEPDATCD